MKQLTTLLLGATLISPAISTAEVSTHSTTLEDLGYPAGLYFDAASVPEERTLLFYLPGDMDIKAATLRLIYHGSRFGPQTSFSVSINESPPQIKEVPQGHMSSEWVITIPPSELKGGQLKVTLRGHVPIDYDTTVGGQPRSGIIHISPDSTLVTWVDGLPSTLRDAWLLLPDEVVVSIPHGILNEMAFKAALDWVTLLQRTHHTVRITTLPDIGNLVIAPESDIGAAIAHVSGQPQAIHPLWSNSKTNIGVVNFSGGTFMVVTAPYADAQRFATHWQELSHYAFIDPVLDGVKEDELQKISFDTLGLSTSPALLGHKLQWSATITPWNLPPGRRPDSATIYIQIPRTEPSKKLRLYVYLNDMMIGHTRYAGDGVEREIFFTFDSVPRSNVYHLRIVARDSGEEDDIKPANHYPIRITPQSYLTLKNSSSPPEGFSSVSTSLGQGFDLYLPADYLTAAQHYLPLIGKLLTGFVVAPADFTIRLIGTSRITEPSRNFIVIGDTLPFEAQVPIRFDEGKLRLVDSHNRTLVSDRHFRLGGVVQLVKSDDASGLWFNPGSLDELPRIDANGLGNDDVAIYQPDHLILSVDSHLEDLARPQYIDNPRWYERLYEQRMLWLLFSWATLTLGVVYLYIKSKQHRAK